MTTKRITAARTLVVQVLLLLGASASASSLPPIRTEVLAEGLNSPWALTQVSDSDWLVTERHGQLRLWDGRQLSDPIKGPSGIFERGQGGLLDIVASRDFADSKRVYLSFSEGRAEANHLALAKAVFDIGALTLTDIRVIFRVTPDKDTPVHFGGRIAQLPDSSLLLTTGDGFDYREQSQVASSGLGKVFHLSAEGEPIGLPAAQRVAGAVPGLFTLGHRNPQGLVYDPVRQRVWSHEHGPAGGDEINVLVPGKNYGWPVITNGKDYSGASITPYTEYPGMEQPFLDWTPSIAPSSMAVYYGEAFPALKGGLLVTTLKSQELRWVELQNDEVQSQHNLLPSQRERYRDVEVAASGEIMLLTDSGKLIKLSPEPD